ncbi:hypothetical protein GCM10017714_14160 [Curtobacterium pusillum]|uniref:Ribose transport system substrate-binding protein n=1 Tax=Curtobacterium pusillum TaxID=69373 RepID=A0AAW3TBZ2_9MICO|nr:substrate-binding domain-containing protein [Curtobacterium pusillum]MBA8991548.1 ribose transport system substrate-binding protein [Curtobacterium pusillum]NUU13741.1 hypothetical protein [Curtobacterium pusillum]GLK30677.1 hypothetical protein GCM10017610_09620 [Curtobacterium pusillum]
MTTEHTQGARQRIAAIALATALLTALAGCSTVSSASSTASSSTADSTLSAKVEKLESPQSSYKVPTASIPDIASLRGKTVYWVPFVETSQFLVTGKALTAALKSVGVSVQICNGNSNPSTINGCISQATSADAGAIITESVPYALAANTLTAAQQKGIPVLVTDQVPDGAHPGSSTLAYLTDPASDELKAIADWIIVDSGGKADVVVTQDTDSPSTKQYIAAAKKEFASQCPACTVTTNPVSSANFSLIPSSTSSVLLKNPDADYVISEFDQFLQPVQGGVQQSGRAASIKGASTAATIGGGLAMLKNKNFLSVDAGQAVAYQGWAEADAALRLMTKQTVPSYDIPFRLFTRDNVGDIALTSAAEASGEWYGPADFTTRFEKLWGSN